MNLLTHQHFYLVGIKGVAMTGMAQLLIDAGKQVQGSDVSQDFVTKKVLDRLEVEIDAGFDHSLPVNTDCVIYTAAHQSSDNPQVRQAAQQNLATYSQAEALAALFNQKQGVAVCGVGGKSTVSAMIAWILESTSQPSSYAVGVGEIVGLNRNAHWREESKYFVTEADEYVIDPNAISKGSKLIPRFSFMDPNMIVSTNLAYDHPDVYQDFTETKQAFKQFFQKLNPGEMLLVNADDRDLLSIAKEVTQEKSLELVTFGTQVSADWQLVDYQSQEGQTSSQVLHLDQEVTLTLKVPGKYNMMNAVAALAVTTELGVRVDQAIKSLAEFKSTKRRFEFMGEKHQVKYYDDYAHHPDEITQAIQALNEWYPTQRKIVAFQSHTFSRTRELFDEFVRAFDQAQEVVMIDIFPSAREKFDPDISSQMLCAAINQRAGQDKAKNLVTIDALADFCRQELRPGDVLLTLGAGDINELHQLID